MKKLLSCLTALAVLLGGALRAQDITGTWQGVLDAGQQQLRTVIKITNEGGGMKAVMYVLEQGGQGIGASAVTLQGSTLKMSVAAINGTYEGKLSADGNAITGTWSQGRPLPLNLTRATADTAWAIPAPPAAMKPMPADANPSFEVATIKPSRPDAVGRAILFRGNVTTINTSLNDLITFAYGLQAKQVTGGPAWIESDKYDVTGKPDIEGMPNDKQIKGMVQKLITERFKLVFHRDKKELSVYALVVARGGPKLTKSQGDPNGLPGLGFGRPGQMQARNANMGDLTSTLQNMVLDRPVIDQTGLAGRFDFPLNWTPDEFQFAGVARVPPPADTATAPNLYTAIQEQLGLRLDSTKAMADVIVIDRVEKPTDN